MQNPLEDKKYFRYVERTPVWLGLAAVMVVIAIGIAIINVRNTGHVFNLGLAYTGGQSLLLEFAEPLPVDGQAVKTIVSKFSDSEPVVQVYANNPRTVSIKLRVKTMATDDQGRGEETAEQVIALKEELGNAYGGYVADGAEPNPKTLEQDFVSPTVGAELIQNALWALFWGCLLIMIYIFWRFGGWQYSVAGIIGLIYDVMFTLAFTAMLQLEISESFIAVVLTIIGYSINSTIITFDRIRENLRSMGESVPFEQVCNISLNQTVVRSINTTLTVVLMIGALLVFGGASLRDFLLAMLAGMVSGAFSSIFLATPLMLLLSRGTAPRKENDDAELALASPAGSMPAARAARNADDEDDSTAAGKAKRRQRRR